MKAEDVFLWLPLALALIVYGAGIGTFTAYTTLARRRSPQVRALWAAELLVFIAFVVEFIASFVVDANAFFRLPEDPLTLGYCMVSGFLQFLVAKVSYEFATIYDLQEQVSRPIFGRTWVAWSAAISITESLLAWFCGQLNAGLATELWYLARLLQTLGLIVLIFACSSRILRKGRRFLGLVKDGPVIVPIYPWLVAGGAVVVHIITMLVTSSAFVISLVRVSSWSIFFVTMGVWIFRLSLVALSDRESTSIVLPEDFAKVLNSKSLTSREKEVCQLLMQGLVLKEVAFQLHISPNTARNHCASVFRKFGVSSRIELAKKLSSQSRD